MVTWNELGETAALIILVVVLALAAFGLGFMRILFKPKSWTSYAISSASHDRDILIVVFDGATGRRLARWEDKVPGKTALLSVTLEFQERTLP